MRIRSVSTPIASDGECESTHAPLSVTTRHINLRILILIFETNLTSLIMS
jgi:hypothetical protein